MFAKGEGAKKEKEKGIKKDLSRTQVSFAAVTFTHSQNPFSDRAFGKENELYFEVDLLKRCCKMSQKYF